MAGKLYVDEIRDTATTGSPAFPNGLDVTELLDPIGTEGDVLTVQADGSIAAAPIAGIPLVISGITDRSDPTEVGAAVLAALPPLARPTPADLYVIVSLTDAAGANHEGLVGDNTGWSYNGYGALTGAGSVLVWGIYITQ